MRCLSPAEVEAGFSKPQFRVLLEHSHYRSALRLDPTYAEGQSRVAAVQPSDIGEIARFVRTLNRWLPTNKARLLWVDHWEAGGFGANENAVVAAAWRGLGETRPLDQAPGLFFEKQNWDEEDQLAIPPAQWEALGLMVGIFAILMLTQSDGWLISSDCADRIEFWEGNIFFHSDSEAKLKQAEAIMASFGCRLWTE